MTAGAGSQRRRVLILVDGIGTFGGGERVARRIATNLDPERFEVTFCVSRGDPEKQAVNDEALTELREAGVELLALGRSSRLQVRPWRRLTAYLREWKPDVLHSHMVGSNIWGALLGPRAGVPVFVAHEHTWSFEGQPWRKFVDRNLIARRADAFVAVSREDKRRMASVELIPEEKLRFIPNGIALEPVAGGGDAVRSELGIEPDRPLVGMVAVMRPQKAFEILLRAASLVRDALPEAQFLVVGGASPGGGRLDDYREEIRKLSAELRLDSTVRFLGSRNDVPELLQAIDVATLSSDYEGSPLSVLEYMAAAKPVVATRVGGVPDQVKDGETGLLVERRDPEALAAALIELLRDPERARKMGMAGRERCEREFSIAAMARRTQDLYEELLAAELGGGG